MPLPSITYPFDPTGILPSNLVTNDQHIVTENNYKDFYFVVPKFGPFFIQGMVVTYASDGVTKTLIEGVDYYGCLPFIGASRSIGKQVYGGISFSDLTLTGAVALKYQTLGGEYLFDDQVVLENIANRVYNPRIVTWEEVTDRPTLFPPTTHAWNLVDQVGQSAVVDALIRIEQAILSRVLDPFSLHITRVDNPHNTNKTQIGLDLVENFPPASILEAKALTATNRLITPATLRAVLLGYSSLKISALPGNLITLQPDGIYYGNSAAPTPTPPAPAPTSAPAPVPAPPAPPAPAPTSAPAPAPSYNESVSMSASGDAGVGVPITIVNGNPNTNVTITDSVSSTVRVVTLDANGSYSNNSNIFVQAGVQTADNISIVVTFTFAGTQHVITKPFTSTRPAAEYVETVFMPDGAVQGSSVHISIDSGKPNTNVTVTDSVSSTVRVVTLDANGHYGTDVVFVQASTQSVASVTFNVTFTFNANGHVITKPFTSTFS